MSGKVDHIGRHLSRPDQQKANLLKLLQISAKGHDVSQAADKIVRHCLFSSTASNPLLISLSLDLLISSPSHSSWVDLLTFLTETLQRNEPNSVHVVLLRIPSLPHAALQHLILFATTPLIEFLTSPLSLSIRIAATNAIASCVLRARPLTAPSIDAIRLEQLNDHHISIVKTSIERLFFALSQALFDSSTHVAIAAFRHLTQYAFQTISEQHSVLNATKLATSTAIWHVLVPSTKALSNRFRSILAQSSKDRPTDIALFKATLRSVSRLIAYILNSKPSIVNGIEDYPQKHQQAVKWSISFVEGTLLSLCDQVNLEMSSSACVSLLLICSYANENPSPDKLAAWGTRALRRINRILVDFNGQLPLVVISGLVRDGCNGLAALSKNEFVSTKFIASTSVGLLPFAAQSTNRKNRMVALSVISSTVVEYDLSGKDTGVGLTMKAILASSSWKSILASRGADWEKAAEYVCCFAQSLLTASDKIFRCTDPNLRLNLTHTWAVMLSQFMTKTIQCLHWPHSPACAFAKELFLKLFDALGQYSAFLMQTKGVAMTEYERIQELMVKATVDQENVNIRASLLVCVTRYWLTSGMKAESNAGHILKAIWKHMEEDYRDNEIVLKELQTGALWSEAKRGTKTPAQRATEGGYVSMLTAISKRKRAAVNTMSAMAATIEDTVFGSIALATAAREGSTLTTDYVYSAVSSLLALTSHNPSLAEKALAVLGKYVSIMDEVGSSDFIALETIQNTMSSIEVYEHQEYSPKPISIRPSSEIMQQGSKPIEKDNIDSFGWLSNITESCIYATSRLYDYSKGTAILNMEEFVLSANTSAVAKMKAFNPTTLKGSDIITDMPIEGDHQVLSGATDPFSVIASHSMDTTKGVAVIRVDVLNRSQFRSGGTSMSFSTTGALVPLPDAPTVYSLGDIDSNASATQSLILSVRRDQGFASQIFITILTRRDAAGQNIGSGSTVEQPCVPYYIPSSDVLLLRPPSGKAGVDVFRRRWDLMRQSISFQSHIRKDQSVDDFVDTFERQSKCLREVGRMRTYSHVSCLVADSSRGDYVAVAVVAPEANGVIGTGPCVLYVTIRSNSDDYNIAFREECRYWIRGRYKVFFPDEDLSYEDKRLAMLPQDSYFITESADRLSPFQRWRAAHAARIAH